MTEQEVLESNVRGVIYWFGSFVLLVVALTMLLDPCCP